MAKTEVAELRDDRTFPIAVAAMGALPNLAIIASRRIGKHGFAVTKEGAARALRLIADGLDAGTILPQELVDATKGNVDDFVLRTVTFTFGESIKVD